MQCTLVSIILLFLLWFRIFMYFYCSTIGGASIPIIIDTHQIIMCIPYCISQGPSICIYPYNYVHFCSIHCISGTLALNTSTTWICLQYNAALNDQLSLAYKDI